MSYSSRWAEGEPPTLTAEQIKADRKAAQHPCKAGCGRMVEGDLCFPCILKEKPYMRVTK